MKKKLVSLLLVSAMAIGTLAGCGNNNKNADADKKNDANVENDANAGDDSNTEEEIPAVGTDTDVVIWVADNVVNFTQAQVDAYIEAHPEYEPYNITIEAVGEGDAASNMITDVVGGADIYGFAQDQTARLVAAGALNPVVGDYQSTVESENVESATSGVIVGDVLYAFPITADNGYFLYYDKSVVTDPSSLEQIIADCESAGKNFYMEINSGWYQPAFFFGTGCNISYETDNDGNFTSCSMDYASDLGLVALKEIIEMASSSSFQNGSSANTATNYAAIIDGTWDVSSIQEVFGDNFACAKLPSFTGSDGNTYQLGSFGGYKYLGVKPQEDASKLQFCLNLAQWLSGEEVQLARYNEVGWGPSNTAAQADEAVQADLALTALAEQTVYSIPQGQYPDDYWSRATSLGDDIISGTISTSTSDEELMSILETFTSDCESYAK